MGTSRASTSPERRSALRFAPPKGLRLVLHPIGLPGAFMGNLSQDWIDVSEGGFQTVVSHRAEAGEVMQARIIHEQSGKGYIVNVISKHVSESRSYPGYRLAGYSFLNPPPALRAYVRRMSRRPRG